MTRNVVKKRLSWFFGTFSPELVNDIMNESDGFQTLEGGLSITQTHMGVLLLIKSHEQLNERCSVITL
jgi:hypothetical protein